MTTLPAHATSLHLFETMDGVKGEPADDAMEKVSMCLERLDLTLDIQLSISGEGTLELKPTTDKGAAVLAEMKGRAELPPCPENECEPGTDGQCKWCGRSVIAIPES